MEEYKKLFEGDYYWNVQKSRRFIINEEVECLDFEQYKEYLCEAELNVFAVFPYEDSISSQLGFVVIEPVDGNNFILYSIQEQVVRQALEG